MYILPCLDDPGLVRHGLLADLKAIPETTPDTLPFVLGGFGALGHPSTFHMDAIRDLRAKAYTTFYTTIYEHQFSEKYALEMLIDRIMLRPPFRKPSRENWHRDTAAATLPDDRIWGGWINLDPEHEQTFSYTTATFKVISPSPQTKNIRMPITDLAFYHRPTTTPLPALLP